jgi:hypothetical protein
MAAPTLIDPERTWLKSTTLWSALIITVTGTLLYARMDNAIRTIQTTIEHDATLHEKDRTEIVGSIREVRDELRKLVSENVSQRQSLAWLDLFQITVQAWIDRMRSDNPTMKIPDLKIPALPR